MTRPVSEPQRVKNHARRSKYQAKAPVTSHETRSQWTLNQVTLPLSSSCVGFIYHKPEGIVHKPFKRDGTANIYARGIRGPSEGETVHVAPLQCSERVPDPSEFPTLAMQPKHWAE